MSEPTQERREPIKTLDLLRTQKSVIELNDSQDSNCLFDRSEDQSFATAPEKDSSKDSFKDALEENPCPQSTKIHDDKFNVENCQQSTKIQNNDDDLDLK